MLNKQDVLKRLTGELLIIEEISIMNPYKKFFCVFFSATLLMSGCASESGGIGERESGALLGAGLGAGLGALAGAATGNAGVGTAIGAGAGLLTGAVAGEASRRQKENTKREIRQEMMAQQYQPQYAPQPYGQQPVRQQPSYTQTAPQAEVHTKYNPRSGQTFPGSYTFDPATGEQLKNLQ